MRGVAARLAYAIPLACPCYCKYMISHAHKAQESYTLVRIECASNRSGRFVISARLSCAAGPPIHHIDLYRLSSPAASARLDLRHTLQTGIALIEWPQKLDDSSLPEEYLCIHLNSAKFVSHSSANCVSACV